MVVTSWPLKRFSCYMKVLTIAAIAFFVSFFALSDGYSQTQKPIIGKWYGYTLRTGLMEYHFFADSIKFSRLNFDGTVNPDPGSTKTTPLIKTVFANGNIYEILDRSKPEDSFQLVTVNILKQTSNKDEMICAINPGERQFKSLDSAMAFIKTDKVPKYGWKMFTEPLLKKYLKMKPIERMTRPQMCAYIDSLLANRPVFDSLQDDPTILGFSMYTQYKIREFIREIGYSPLFETTRLDALVKTNSEDPEIKERLDYLKGLRKPQ